MKSIVKQRLMKFAKFRNLSISKFESLCGLGNGYVSKLKGEPGSRKLEDILKAFPELNREWLLYGEGEMLKASTPGVMQNNVNGDNNYTAGNIIQQSSTPNEEVPYAEAEEVERAPILPATLARAPQVDILEAVNERIGKIELAPIGVFDVPITLWYRVQDESVAPKFEIGDLIALWAYPKGQEDPVPGKLYGINTLTNGLIIRKLLPHDDGYIARSANREDFPDYHIKRDNIVQIYKIILMVRL